MQYSSSNSESSIQPPGTNGKKNHTESAMRYSNINITCTTYTAGVPDTHCKTFTIKKSSHTLHPDAHSEVCKIRSSLQWLNALFFRLSINANKYLIPLLYSTSREGELNSSHLTSLFVVIFPCNSSICGQRIMHTENMLAAMLSYTWSNCRNKVFHMGL